MQEGLSARRWIDGNGEGLERLNGRFFSVLLRRKIWVLGIIKMRFIPYNNYLVYLQPIMRAMRFAVCGS